MNVILYSGFTKRVNSTARPSNATARTFDCVLKQGTSMIAPTIILDVGLETAPTAYTYAYIPDFNRYYWVRDWVNVHPVWHCSLTCDVLASGRSEILAYNAYVLRSSGAEYEGQLNDATCVTFTDPQIQIANISLFAAAPADYTYVVGIVADSTQSVALSGTTTYYVLTQAEMNAFRAFLLNDFDDYAGTLGSFTDPNMVKLFFNPSDYIVSCVCNPVPLSAYTGTTTTTIRLGWWDSGVTARYLGSRTVTSTLTFAIPYHPAYVRDNTVHDDLQYLNYPPYSNYALVLPCYGAIALSADAIDINQREARISHTIDVITGTSLLLVYQATTPRRILAFVPGAVGFACDWGSVTTTPMYESTPTQIMNGMVAGEANAANKFDAKAAGLKLLHELASFTGTGGAALDKIASLSESTPYTKWSDNVIQGYNARNSFPGYGGGAGSAAVHGSQFPGYLQSKFFDISERNVSELGRPYCHYQVLGSEMNTIVYCQNPHVVSPLLTAGENELINNALESGVEIE